MNRRTPIFAVIVAVVVTMLGYTPAQADLDDPVVSDLATPVAGHVTGTVTSVAPYVRVRLRPFDPQTMVTMVEGSGTFDLETWGYAGTRSVLVSACEVAEPSQVEDCSTEVSSTATFVPVDVSPEVTWPSDTTLGPDDEAPTVTVSDPLGGGDLRARWVNGDEFLDTPLVRDVATPVEIPSGNGVIRVIRCSAVSPTVCTPFNPDLSIPVELRLGVIGTLGPIDTLTSANPTSSVVVDTDVTGTYELTWTLEQDGTAVPGHGGSASGVLDASGAAAPFEIDGSDLFDGEYDVVVSLELTGTEYGDLPGGATGSVTVDGAGPEVAATVGAIAKLTRGNPSSTVTVDTDQSGTYALSWHLEQNGTDVPGIGTTEPLTGTLDPNGATQFSLSGSALTDGVYDVVATITVTDPELGTFPPVEAVGTVTVDKTGPAVTLTRSVATIYPLIGTTSFPGLSRVDVVGDPGTITGFVVVSAGGTVVRNLGLNVNKTVWNGRDNAGKVVVANTYSVYAVDADGNRNATGVLITVSRQTLVAKKFVKEVSASGSMFDKFIGKCSQLKIPSSRGVRGSLGFYANTKCTTQTFASSAVSTAHAIRLPVAAKYVDVRVNVTGGAATAKRTSKGIVRYLNTKGAWTSETTISSAYGIHTGPTRSTTGLVDPNQFFVWGFVTAYGSRYDVIRFTVVVHYYVLS